MALKTDTHSIAKLRQAWKLAGLMLLIYGLPLHAQAPHPKTLADVTKESVARGAQAKAAAAALPNTNGSYKTFDIPGSSYMQAEGINARGEIVGAYQDTANNLQNFVLKDGNLHLINPQTGMPEYLFLTTQVAINSEGDIVATYADGNGVSRGFLLSEGEYTYINAPGASQLCAGGGTWPAGINASGDIVGWYVTQECFLHAFLLRDGGLTTFDVPIALGAQPGTTQASGINERGDIVGQYSDTTGNSHGFLLTKGNFSTIDVSGPLAQTFPLGINSRGEIVGITFATGGFLMSHGTITSIDVPGSSFTVPYGINKQGDIVGTYFDSNNNTHGFVLGRR